MDAKTIQIRFKDFKGTARFSQGGFLVNENVVYNQLGHRCALSFGDICTEAYTFEFELDDDFCPDWTRCANIIHWVNRVISEEFNPSEEPTFKVSCK